MARDELVTIEGTVEADRAPFVDASIDVGDEQPFEHRADFDIVTSDGSRVRIELAKNPVLRPTRKEHGTWRELQAHPVKPPGDYHPDGRLALRGEWILPGERVCVIGYVKGHDFVPDTGSHREAPQRKLSLVRAIAIGVGDDAAKHAKQAMKQRERELAARSRPKPMPSNTRWAWLAITCFMIAITLAIAKHRANLETLGFALVAALFALLFFWCASPTAMFPGGAVDNEEVTEPGVMTGFVTVLMLPTAILLALLTDEPVKRSAMASAGWIMLGLYPIGSVLRGVIAKPRPLPGSQVRLPASPVRRWILVAGLVLTWIAAVALAVPHLSADGPMT